jgi:hypothetical protein
VTSTPVQPVLTDRLRRPQNNLSAVSLVSSAHTVRKPFSFTKVRSHSPSPSPSRRLSPTAPFTPTSHEPTSFTSAERPPLSRSPNSDLLIPYHKRDSHTRHLNEPSTSARSNFSTAADQLSASLSRQSESSIRAPSLSQSLKAKEISSPILHTSTVLGHSHGTDNLANAHPKVAGVNGLAGWTDRPPAFNLISLEEARSRSRSVSSQGQSPISKGPISSVAFPDHASSDHPSPSSGLGPSKTRVRSQSAGPRTKLAVDVDTDSPSKPDCRDTDNSMSHSPAATLPPGKTLRNRKSGFLRLFGKDDKPPPVPALSDDITSAFPPQAFYKPPQISDAPHVISPQPLLIDSPEITAKQPSPPKRTPPPLNFPPRNQVFLAPASAKQGHFPPQSNQPPDPMPQSAPPNVNEFPLLKLRPVSTMFSAHFADHLLNTSPDMDSDSQSSATSPSTVLSPITPSVYFKSDQKRSFEDEPATIRSLQDQIAATRHAWQRQVEELESQNQDLKAELDQLKGSQKLRAYCENCGKDISFRH